MNRLFKFKSILLGSALFTAPLTAAHDQVVSPLIVSQRGLAYDLQPLGLDHFALVWVGAEGSHLCLLTTLVCKDAGLPPGALAPRLVLAPQGLRVVWATVRGELFTATFSQSGELGKPLRLYTAPAGQTPLWGDQYGDALVQEYTLHVAWLERPELKTAPLRLMRLKVIGDVVEQARQIGQMNVEPLERYSPGQWSLAGARRLPALYSTEGEVLTVLFGEGKLDVQTFRNGWDIQLVREAGGILPPLELNGQGFEVTSDSFGASSIFIYTQGVPELFSTSKFTRVDLPASLDIARIPHPDSGGLFYKNEAYMLPMLSQRDDGLVLVTPRFGALDAHVKLGTAWKGPFTIEYL